jgi:hypothetical protein
VVLRWPPWRRALGACPLGHALAGHALAGQVLAGQVLAGQVLAGQVLAGDSPGWRPLARHGMAWRRLAPAPWLLAAVSGAPAVRRLPPWTLRAAVWPVLVHPVFPAGLRDAPFGWFMP